MYERLPSFFKIGYEAEKSMTYSRNQAGSCFTICIRKSFSEELEENTLIREVT